MDEQPTGGSFEAVIQPINEVVPKQVEERVIVGRAMATQTEKRVSQKQLDALAKGRALNQERRKKYIEFEKLQKMHASQAPQPPPIPRAVSVQPSSYSLKFV